MKERSPQLSPDELNSLFAQLNPLDVEQFYTAYQLWIVQQRIQTQQALIDAIQRDIAENTTYMEQTHPSALALATLAHLQTKGASDITLLDRMLERGEGWLDRTMQRLDYCETIDVISGDYTKWCENALEGAYDWIDSMTGQEAVEAVSTEASSSTEPVNGTIEPVTSEETSADSIDSMPSDENIEELFLQKLMSDDTEPSENLANTEIPVIAENEEAIIEDEISLLETTLKIGAVSPLPEEAVLPESDNAEGTAPSVAAAEDADTIIDTINATDSIDDALIEHSSPVELPTEQETGTESVEPTPVLAETHAIQTEETMMAVEEPMEQEQEPPSLHEEQEIAPSPPAEEKPERGFWRTLIAVLFHI